MDLTELSAEADAFFSAAPPLRHRQHVEELVKSFVARQVVQADRALEIPPCKVVCVTSGGTTVPLERRCVRFIDNFSSGHRGAASTEYFLEAGYAVVFLHRSGSANPFCRFLPENLLLDCLEPAEDSVQVCSKYFPVVKDAVHKHHAVSTQGNLLMLQFATLFEYLQMLQIVATAFNHLTSHAMFYLAAAVSDFYVPWESMEEHKIQSSTGPLDLQLAPVPKMVPLLRQRWAPKAFCVSFKLETDMEILVKKAKSAQQKYGMHAVVANELLTRKQKVVVITAEGETTLTNSSFQDVEKPLVDFLVQQHRLLQE